MPTRQPSGKGQEMQRKFLVARRPDGLGDCPFERIRQGYLAIAEGGLEVRVRQQGQQYFLTIKGGMKGPSRLEKDIEIGRKQFRALWPLTRGQRLRKRRYHVPHGDLTIEVDVYRGKLKGLTVAEVEFPDKGAAREFSPPEWFGRDVTADSAYSNSRLALDGRPGADQAE
jgi:CYTH domain-containing protein